MRHPRLAALALVVLAAPAAAAPPVPFDDAAVHALQFVDAREGWAVGDDGVVWHSIDGGASWERQKTGTRASLRAVHFQTPYTGWVVGRLDQPGGVSVGVMLKTTDGGLKWDEVGTNVMPGLHAVRFSDGMTGFVCGDGTDAFPSGMFETRDGGVTWRPVAGPRSPGWRAADFPVPSTGLVAGAWSKVGTVSGGVYAVADLDPLGGRTVHAIASNRPNTIKGYPPAFAAGDGGLVLTSTDGGRKWGSVNLGLSPAALANCDLRCVAAVGGHVWVAGRPGSVVLHSGDGGKTWEVQKTGLSAAVQAVYFLNDQTGWLAGEFGTIAGTTDGGKTWTVQRAGGQRAAALFVHAHGRSVPLDSLALLGHADGYLCAAVGVTAADPATADPKRANDPARLRQAARLAGGVAAESVWCFPVPAHADGLPPRELLALWDGAHGGKANEQLLRQAVLAIRVWQPEVIVTDVAAADAKGADVLVLHAAKEAFTRAADPAAFPEQMTDLGLKPWAAKKLYALSPDDAKAPVKLDLADFRPALGATVKEFAEPAGRVLSDVPAADRRCFKLVAHRLAGAETHAGLMDGVVLARGGAARRPEVAAGLDDPEVIEVLKKAAQTRRHLEALAAAPDAELAGADKAIALLGQEAKRMPDDTAARTIHAVGAGFARAGKWAEAREVFALLTAEHPGHPLAVEAYRWLLRYHAGTEPRRRVEITQKLTFARVAFEPSGDGSKVVQSGGVAGSLGPTQAASTTEDVYRMYDAGMIVRWHQTALDLEPRLAAFGPAYARDPSAALCLLAARRQVGRHADAEAFVRDYFKANPSAGAKAPGADPWRDCLAAELWLSDKGAFPLPPKPVAACRHTDARPFLDGKLDDACWKSAEPLAVGGGADDAYKTEARFAYDGQFVYVAVSCSHPAGKAVPAAGKRGRDADLSGHDRVDIVLDLDRDYQTYYRFQVDHRGCLAEDCWGDGTWNPKYFVAFTPSETGWCAEYAIPVVELTGDRPTAGRAWAVNVVRVVPGVGVKGWSGPADADPRPEGLGLLQFRAEK
ncbi:MAG: hypothetical protein K2X82_03090 [Gemmataceae bacterium]|nr:hypothetical protein [Gemmataceae bacterium]